MPRYSDQDDRIHRWMDNVKEGRRPGESDEEWKARFAVPPPLLGGVLLFGLENGESSLDRMTGKRWGTL